MPASAVKFVRRGSGSPMLLVHGLSSELRVWDPVLDALAADHDVIAVDLPGFGGSAPLADGVVPTPAALAGQLGGLLDSLGLSRTHVVGNSLGGWVALELAVQGRALSVTALCPAGLWSGPLNPAGSAAGKAQRAARLIRPLLPAAMASGSVRRRALSTVVAHPERVPYRDALRMADGYARATDYERTNDAMRAGHFTGLAGIDVPATVVFGDRDRLINPVPIAAPNVRRVMLEDCGHMPMWDQPERTVELISETAARAASSAAGIAASNRPGRDV